MNPNACWEWIVGALREQEREEAIKALRALVEWLEKGGVFPVVD